MTCSSVMSLQVFMNLWVGYSEGNSLQCLGFGPAEDTCTFPESDTVGMLTPDVTVDESTSPRSLSPLGAAASISLSVHSESDVDEDSWITFSDYRSGNELLVLRLQWPFLCLLLQAVWELFQILDP
ncbi:hypothetical protein Tco_1467738 [Tanacetum coccineum]|uniref:Uncharacterized protein n=1 Tax=Tanacetum coccineum TaxID=301880 RepID=A0ABQ4WNI3_9ASTR